MMGALRTHLGQYLAFRRKRGFALDMAARMLESFVIFVERKGDDIVTRELFTRWNGMHPASHTTMERRAIAVRTFAKWLRNFDLRHEVPPPYRGLLGKNRPKPHIYTDGEVAALLDVSAKLESVRRIRALTYPVLWALLYVTGVRIGEALAINVAQVDLDTGTILIPARKGSYDRLVPLHATTVEALKAFLRRRNRLLGFKPECLFTDERRERLRYPAVGVTFAEVGKLAGLRPPGRKMGEGPTIHGLRHTFAVNTLKRWYREGEDVKQHILTLVDALGHSSLRDTYWYLEAVPELLHLASRRMESYLAEGGEPS
jgi:integrase